MTQRLSRRVATLEHLISELLTDHSEIRPPEQVPGVLLVIGNFWEPLSPEGRRLQSRILRELERVGPLVRTLLHGVPNSLRNDVDEALKAVDEAVDQSHAVWSSDAGDVLKTVLEHLEKIQETLAQLYDPAEEPIYVPDANAVMWNPALDEWSFNEQRFTLALTSTLLEEIDELKTRDRNESVRDKAERVIRQVREYRRRGDVHAGVTLRRDRSTVRMFAIEPDFSRTLPWLDLGNKDDRLVAQTIEVMRAHPHSIVVLVTRDGNVMNKADLAGIPTVEPPDPPAEEPRAARKALPDVRILSIRTTGGGHGVVTFSAEIQNHDTKLCRVHVRATVGGESAASVRPSTLDLLVNMPPESVSVSLRRPEHGDLVKAFNDETTIYGESLLLEVVDADGDVVASKTWRENLYDDETNGARAALQQRIWRMGRGQETADDRRAIFLAEHGEDRD